MIWANLAMLGLGGLMLSVPVLIHFLMQPKPVEVDFPALRFLKQKQLINRSRTRLRHILLLLLRCILIALLVLALAGPAVASQQFGKWLTFGGISFIAALLAIVLAFSWFSGSSNRVLNGVLGAFLALMLLLAGWYGLQLFDDDSSGQILGNAGEPVAAIMLIDTSPTMQYELENETRLKKASSMATWLVNQMPSGSQICVSVPDGDRPFFSPDESAAARRIESLTTSYNPKSILETLAKAIPLLEESPLPRKEVYIVSDLTRNGWSSAVSDPAISRLIKDTSISIFVLDVGVEDPVDFRIGDLNLSARQITSNGSLTIKTSINRIGAAEQRNVKLSVEKPDFSLPVVSNGTTLFPKDAWEFTQPIDVRENSSAPVEFTFTEQLEPGVYHGKVEIVGKDPLAIDDQQYFTFEVGMPWKVLVIQPANARSEFLARVLQYSGSFDVTFIDQAKLQDAPRFGEFNALFVLNPKPLTDDTWDRLAGFAESGGGVCVFLGHNAAGLDGLPHESFQTPSAARVLSGTLVNQFRCPDRIEAPFLFSPLNFDHPILSAFREISTSVRWDRNPIFTHWGLEMDNQWDELPTTVVLQFSNREPAIIERRIGSGRILIMTTPLEQNSNVKGRRTWNQRLSEVVWFYITRALTRHVVQTDADSLDVQVGQPAVLINELTRYPDSWNVFSPDPAKPPTKVSAIANKVRYPFTDTPGHYRFKGVLDGPILRGFSATLDPATLDLTRLELDELDKVLGAGRYQLARDQDEITRKQGQARKGREFYPLLMLMMFAAVVIEYLVSNRFYKS